MTYLAVVVQLSKIGIVVGCSYVVAISSILWWMLHIPAAGGTEQKVNRAVREAAAFARILVPVQGGRLSDKMVALACQMARYRHAEISLLYVIEVPLTLPGNAAMPNDEAQANQVFERATKIANRFGVTMRSEIYKTRQAGPGVVSFAREGRYDVILMGDIPRRAKGGTEFARTVEYIYEHAPSEVLIYRPAPDAVEIRGDA
ncbi:MAG TPA: universal stress protein [Chloroflexota bacterium]|jgi:nucleotide-binding universal stress UspA family protein|nr:universal stress protein [Chloroflexota bacterium]